MRVVVIVGEDGDFAWLDGRGCGENSGDVGQGVKESSFHEGVT